ncbi:YfiM family lipoprotein [Proteus myxofaciens]|uniref:Putative outer membrane lipoprotein n=1 Tax=Proteus myxofaciens ATCC 19692 TaxID=1354337 RepID=A0A198FI27_9GAMM|nr:YfiM family lipoprotein [Proteus myxofaciens]OAT24543.1 putative outer membrane lipoprotein [Proteus myxofaciens ATCC 19692]
MKLKLIGYSLIILSSSILTGCQSFHFANDNWRGKDKAQHFLFSMASSAGANAYADHQNYGHRESLLIGLSFSISLGAAKELYDSRPTGTGWSWHDFAYDVAGALSGTLLYQQLK